MAVDFYAVGLSLLIGMALGFIAGHQPRPSWAPTSRPPGATDEAETHPPSEHGVQAFVVLLNDTLESQGIAPLTQAQAKVLETMIAAIAGRQGE